MVITLSKFRVQITSFYGLFGIQDLDPVVGFVLSIFVVIVVTNAFNLIDGLDGLAGTIAVICLVFFGVWFTLVGERFTPILIFSMLGAILAFLSFNWQPAKIFMGDTGALILGFLFSILAISFMEVNYHLEENNMYKFGAPISVAISVIIIPLCDTLRIFIIRFSKLKSPFKADKSHIHHALVRMGLKHYQTTLVLGLVNVLFILFAFEFAQLGDNLLLPIILGLAILFSLGIDVFIKRKMSRKTKYLDPQTQKISI